MHWKFVGKISGHTLRDSSSGDETRVVLHHLNVSIRHNLVGGSGVPAELDDRRLAS